MIKDLRNIIFFLTHLISAIPIRFLFQIDSNGKNIEISKVKRYILAANHSSKLDPFIILAGLPLKTFLKLSPFAFLTAEYYLKKWYYKPFLLMWSCVSNKEKDNLKPLQRLKNQLENKETVFIFPIGEIEKKVDKGLPKVGVVYLEREVKNSYILPIKVEFTNKITLLNLLKRRIKTKIIFKKDFRHKEFSKDLQPLANDVMNKIFN